MLSSLFLFLPLLWGSELEAFRVHRALKSSHDRSAFSYHIKRTKFELKSSKINVETITSTEATKHPMRVAYQGEPGAYSEKAAKELLGDRILTLPQEVRD